MRVTIEDVEPNRAMSMLMADNLLQFLAEFMAWCEGPGRECCPPDVTKKMRELAVIHAIPMG